MSKQRCNFVAFGAFLSLQTNQLMSICAKLGINPQRPEGGRDWMVTKAEAERIREFERRIQN